MEGHNDGLCDTCKGARKIFTGNLYAAVGDSYPCPTCDGYGYMRPKKVDKIVPADTPLYRMITSDGFPARDWTKDALSPPILMRDVVTTPFGMHLIDGLPQELRNRWRAVPLTKFRRPDRRVKAGRTLWEETVVWSEAVWLAKATEGCK